MSSGSSLRTFVLPLWAMRPALARAVVLTALLVVELIGFGITFDLGSLPPDANFWSKAFIRTPRAVALLIATVLAAGLVGGKTLWTEAAESYQRMNGRHRWRWWLALHLAAMGLLYWTTSQIFALAEAGSAPTRDWTALWLALAAAALACSACALFPAALWPHLAWQARWAVLGGIPLGAVAWLAAWASGRVGWKLLGNVTIVLVEKILSLVYPATVSDLGTMTVGTPDFAVDVVATCSGYQGIGLISVFVSAYLWLFRSRLRFPRAWMLLPLGIFAIWLANVARIVLLIMVGASGWPEIAHGGFHSQAGWLAFNAVALGLVAIAAKSRYLNTSWVHDRAASQQNASVAYLAPFLGTVLTAMLTAVWAQEFDWYYPARVVIGSSLLMLFRASYSELKCDFAWHSIWLAAATAAAWLSLVPVDQATAPKALPTPEGAAALWTTMWLAAKTIGYVFVTPFVEELAFRGYLMRRLISADFQHVQQGQFTWRALIVSSLLFGALHGQNWLPASLAGFVFGGALRQRGKLLDAVVAHAATNGLVTCFVFTKGDWSLWS